MSGTYFLLNDSCRHATDHVERMMCRVVQFRETPLYRYAPLDPLGEPEASHNPRDILPYILPPKPKLTADRKDFFSKVRGTSLLANLSKYLGFDGDRKEEGKINLDAKEVRQYAIDNPEQIFNELMKRSKPYKQDVRRLLKYADKNAAFLVVRFFTTSNAQWSYDSSATRGVKLNVTVPVNEALGVPIPGLDVDPQLSVGKSTAQTRHRSFTSAAEEIFAVQYVHVQLSTNKTTGRAKITLGNPVKPKAGAIMYDCMMRWEACRDDAEDDYLEDRDVEIEVCEDLYTLPDEEDLQYNPALSKIFQF